MTSPVFTVVHGKALESYSAFPQRSKKAVFVWCNPGVKKIFAKKDHILCNLKQYLKVL